MIPPEYERSSMKSAPLAPLSGCCCGRTAHLPVSHRSTFNDMSEPFGTARKYQVDSKDRKVWTILVVYPSHSIFLNCGQPGRKCLAGWRILKWSRPIIA